MWEDEREIECPKHGSTFSLETGEPQSLPATKPGARLRRAGRRRRRDREPPVSVLRIADLHASVAGQEILRGVDLEVQSGEVHALMGPNGSGKSTLSHVLMGRGDYAVTGGSVTIDGDELLGLPTHERAARGLFLALQYPVELPGVRLDDFLDAALRGQGRDADGAPRRVVEPRPTRLGVAQQFLERGAQRRVLRRRAEAGRDAAARGARSPKFAVLDEIDSGLDVDALRDVARRVEAMTTEDDLGVLAITHYARLLDELRPDVVHVLMGGRVVQTGGPELAAAARGDRLRGPRRRARRRDRRSRSAATDDPFADPLGF